MRVIELLHEQIEIKCHCYVIELNLSLMVILSPHYNNKLQYLLKKTFKS